MKKLFVLFTILGLSLSAQARSLHPCTPTVQAQPTFINCIDDDKSYSIIVNTLMSPYEGGMCTGDNYYEYKTAKVQIAKRNGEIISVLELKDGEFTYDLSHNGVTFSSPANGLELNKCVTPIHGGFSIGN